ncbi:MAG: HNH endonuclease [Actinomycetota bacterium]|nr:HNH endonuclease [Actinomycetota bacterium]
MSAVILDRIAAAERERARIEAEVSSLMLDYEDEVRREAEKNESAKIAKMEVSFAADELALVLLTPTRTVQCRLAQARRVRGRMPLTWLACRRGDLDGYRVQLIAEAAAKLVRPDSVMALDHKVSDYAARHTTAQLRVWCRRFIARTEPDLLRVRKAFAWKDRSVWFDHDPDGVSWMHAMLKTPDAVRLDAMLRKVADKRADGDPGLTVEQARADVAADLLLGRIDVNDQATGRTHVGATIGVVVPVLSLAGLTDEPGESFDGQFMLDAETVRALAAEKGTLFYRVFTDPLGRILDVTEMGRFSSTKLRTAIQLRDGSCGFPTCSRSAVESDLDHVVPVPQGPTAAANQRHLCRRHHRMKTYRIVETTMAGDRHTWHLPSGVSVDSETRHYDVRQEVSRSRLEHDFANWLVGEYAA